MVESRLIPRDDVVLRTVVAGSGPSRARAVSSRSTSQTPASSAMPPVIVTAAYH